MIAWWRFCSQYLTMRGTTPSLGIGKAFAGSEWKMFTENRGSLAGLFGVENASSSTGDFRFRCLMAANSPLSSSHENRSYSGELADAGLMSEVFTTSPGGRVGWRLGSTFFFETGVRGRGLSISDVDDGFCRR